MFSINFLYGKAADLATNPQRTKWISPTLFALDAILCTLIIWKVPCTEYHFIPPPTGFNFPLLNELTDTEIDWQTYMQQVQQYISGERDYTKISGETGPLVYPAAHVYIYKVLYWTTDQGRDVLLAQTIFAIVYLATLGIVMICYTEAKVLIISVPNPFEYAGLRG